MSSQPIWQRAAVWIPNPHNFGAVALGQKLVAHGVTAAFVLALDGLEPINMDGGPADLYAWLADLQEGGIKHWALWANLRTDPAEEAAMLSQLRRQLAAPAVVCDAEDEHRKATGGDPTRTSRFLRVFRPLEPSLQLAVTTLGNVGAFPPDDYDLDAWRKAGARLLPQCYTNIDAGNYDPAHCYQLAIERGWSSRRLHAALPAFEPRCDPTGPLNSLRAAQALATHSLGFSIYSQDSLQDAELAAYTAAGGYTK